MGPQLHSVSLNALALELVLIHAVMTTAYRVQGWHLCMDWSGTSKDARLELRIAGDA